MNDFVFNKVGTFYLKEDNKLLDRKLISNLFEDLKQDPRKTTDVYKSGVVIQKQLRKGSDIFYSFCCFMIRKNPVNLPSNNDFAWKETKLAYILIVEYKKYVIITKKYFTDIGSLKNKLFFLDYSVLSNLFNNTSTVYKRINMKNSDLSNTAVRSRSIESENLKNNLTNINLNQYILNSCKLSENGEIYSLALNNSKITNLNQKVDLNNYCTWGAEICDSISTLSINNDSILSLFAKPVDYAQEKDSLIPSYVLIHYQNMEEEIDAITYKNKPVSSGFLKALRKSVQTSIPVENLRNINIKLNKKRISLQSKHYDDYSISFKNGKKEAKLLDYIDDNNLFTVTFENIDYKYLNGKLFRDTHLRTSLSSFITVFEKNKKIENITSEKGSFKKNQTFFDSDCEFGFVESEFLPKYDYFICDDLNNEWADHIGINYDADKLANNKIAFFHSKYDTTKFSASSFEVVVSQALKNLGNLTPLSNELDDKKNSWDGKKYNLDSVCTDITRLRKGSSVTDAISAWKNVMNMPFFEKEVYLITNFISISTLKNNITKLESVRDSRDKRTYIQLIWLISSLVSQCREQNISLHIVCKP